MTAPLDPADTRPGYVAPGWADARPLSPRWHEDALPGMPAVPRPCSVRNTDQLEMEF